MRKVSLFSVREDKPPKSILKPLAQPSQKELCPPPQDETNDSAKTKVVPSSIYSIVAATKVSRDLKEKSKELMAQRRNRGDWGDYDLAHAWSPEDQGDDGRSVSPSNRLEREATTASEIFVNMARPYVMKPVKVFQECKVKAIIKDVLEENLENKKYEPNLCKDMSIFLCNQLKERVKRLRYPRYKYVCHVIIGDVNNHDVRFASRGAWDSRVDSYAVYEYKSFTLYAVGIIFAVYCE